MQKLPHNYVASALGEPGEPTTISSPSLEDLMTETTPEFGGPEGYWSPETMLLAAVANCFILTWRSIADYNKIEWTDLKVEASGVLDRVDRVTRFTKIHQDVQLLLPPGVDRERIEQLLHKTEAACLVTNSLNSELSLAITITEG